MRRRDRPAIDPERLERLKRQQRALFDWIQTVPGLYEHDRETGMALASETCGAFVESTSLSSIVNNAVELHLKGSLGGKNGTKKKKEKGDKTKAEVLRRAKAILHLRTKPLGATELAGKIAPDLELTIDHVADLLRGLANEGKLVRDRSGFAPFGLTSNAS